MAIRLRWRGSGITKRPQPILDAGNLVETFSYLAEHKTFEGWVRVAETWARGILIKAGCKASELDDTRTLLLVAQQADEDGNADSDQDFAARILEQILRVRTAIKARDAGDAAIMDAVRLGELVTLHDTKMLHETTWGTGYKQRRTLKDTRDEANAKRHTSRKKEWERWNCEAALVWKRHPDFRPSAVALIVAKKLKLHENVRSIAHRLKKPAQAG
jgi:hypothetical protein